MIGVYHMKELSTWQYSLVRPLVQGAPHNGPVIFSVIEGAQSGRVFAEREENPSFAIIVLEDILFFAGTPSDTLHKADIHRLLHEQISTGEIPYYELQPLSMAWYPLLTDAFGNEICARRVRKTFSITPEHLADESYHLSPQLAEPYRCCLMNEKPEGFWAPHTRRFGVAIMEGDEAVCTCVAVFVGDGMAEVSIDTMEGKRRQGLATYCAKAFFRECTKRGLHPNWACWQERTASAALAEKLGFAQSYIHEVPIVKM